MDKPLKAAIRWAVFVIAVAVTTAWVVLSVTYLYRLGWDGILSLEPGALAAILAAVAGPPAAVWLVLVVIAQQQELGLLHKAVLDLGLALRRGQDQAETNGRALIELTTAMGQMVAKESVRMALDDLASHAAVVAERLGVLDGARLEKAWARYGAGDRWALIHPFVERAGQESDFESRLRAALYEDSPSKVAAAAFVRGLESLRQDHVGSGDQKLLSQILDDGPAAQVESLFGSSDILQASSVEAGEALQESALADAAPEDVEAATMADRLGPQPTLFPAGSQKN